MRIIKCRICSGPEAPINIFDPGNGHLVRQILSITGVELSCHKEISCYMCMVCLGDLESAIKFRQRCIISEKQNLERIDTASKGYLNEPILQEDIDDDQIELTLDESILIPEIKELPQAAGEVSAPISAKLPISIVKADPYVCEECGKTINNRANFQEHKLRHKGIKDFRCHFGECGKCFSTRKELMHHNRSHKGVQPYVCIYCPRRFSNKSSRQEHHRRHTNERRFQCDVCEKSFTLLF
ncbi:oocyte zinc finger protein XlCOF7.1 isoform X2 [Drosophila ficusphila]|uniref:oocyte zinc finger protein XlCOF7.1 isoform X2 n=1 Tax=Drosophila ficusphila TaxID=30025 RepID=UPI0007E7BB55|nr:oocyte zinc finger protein XlCOF7.1 isoform X2 [Drosophila ficusphila]